LLLLLLLLSAAVRVGVCLLLTRCDAVRQG